MTELERFKVILATICLEHDDDITLGEALLIAEEIDARMSELPLEGVRVATADPMSFDDFTQDSVVDAWLRTQLDIMTMAKIQGIKEIRARTRLSLLKSKKAHERVFSAAT